MDMSQYRYIFPKTLRTPSTVLITGAPIPTVTETVLPPAIRNDKCLIPDNVSISSSHLSVNPRSNTYLPTQRTALPHILPSEPSALNIRILKSAISERQISTIPSPPTPVCRSDSRTASAGMSCGKPSRQFIYT